MKSGPCAIPRSIFRRGIPYSGTFLGLSAALQVPQCHCGTWGELMRASVGPTVKARPTKRTSLAAAKFTTRVGD